MCTDRLDTSDRSDVRCRRQIDGNTTFSHIHSVSQMSKISSKFLDKKCEYTPENMVYNILYILYIYI